MTTWRTWWPRIAITVLLLILLAPIAVTLGARSLADVPTGQQSTQLPPLPTPGPDAIPSLDGLVDPLPVVVRDLPDDESSRAVEAYDRATLLDSSGGRDMFSHAWSSLVIAPEYDDEMALLAAELMPDSVTPSFGSAIPALRERVSPLLAFVMPALREDPRNADRLNNAAVGLLLYEIEMLYGSQPFGEECGIRGSERYLAGALMLLQETDRAFVSNRAVLLNLGFFTSLAGDVAEATKPISRLLAQEPADRRARLLLGNLIARQVGAPDALDAAVTTLTPLVTGEGTEALGHAAVGDAYLTAALASRGVSPFLSHERAMQALAEYDLALALTTDPGVYAGRAAVLDLLGSREDAIAALEQAVDRAPSSISLRIGIALLYQRAGNFDQMREHARVAVAESTDDWNPRLADMRYARAALEPYESIEPGYLSFSYGSDKDLAPLRNLSCGAGGGYIVTLNLFPSPEPWAMRSERFDFAPDVAIELTRSSTVLLGDTETAASDWDDKVVIEAAQLIAGSDTSHELEQGSWSYAVRQLEDAGEYAKASEMCERFGDPRCAGVNAYLAKDFERASSSLDKSADESIQRYTSTDLPIWYDSMDGDGMAILRAADAAREAGNQSRARELYTVVTSREDRSSLYAAIGYTKLAELALDSGDPGQAIPHLDAALELIHSREYRDELEGALPDSRGPAAQAMQVAHNNRGIARLWEAMPGSGGAPDCMGHGRELCQGAQDDFTLALESDPKNPVYLLNMGWVARLLGDAEGARTYLTESTTIDASLYPSYNDLGVFAANDGNREKAHASFMDAAAANPDYDLALWNLGVLEMGRGGLGLLSGQAYLARAIEQNASLRPRDEDPAFKMDERVYRVAVDSPDGNGFSFGQASSVAAGPLGTVSFLAAIWLTLKNRLPDTFVEWAWTQRTQLVRRGVSAMRLHGAGIILLTTQLLNRVRTDLRLDPLGSFMSRLAGLRPPERWRAPLAWVVTMTVLVSVTVWPVWREDAYVRPSQVTLALFAVLSALVVHEVGHVLAARRLRARISYTQWPLGVVLAPVLLPFGLNCGPFMGQRVEGVEKAQASCVYLSGPAANLAAALIMYGLFLYEPLPMLRMLAQVHVAAAAYALIPFEPLDGAYLNKHRPAVASAMGFTVTLVSILFVVGRL